MGCDIHMSVQLRAVSSYARNDATVQRLMRALGSEPERWPELEAIEIRAGEWETVAIETYGARIPEEPGWRAEVFPWRNAASDEEASRYGDWVATTLRELPRPWWVDRDYETFARLAGVRNYNDVVPICEPRGLPEGWSCPVIPDDDFVGDDGEPHLWLGDHSHTWLLASEVIAYQGWGGVRRSGLVLWDEWVTWADAGFEGSPSSWCGWSSGETISREDALSMRARGERPKAHFTFVDCSWEDARKWPALEMAQAWAQRFGAENVRFVFGFDS